MVSPVTMVPPDEVVTGIARPRQRPGVTPGCRIDEIPGTAPTGCPGIIPDRTVIAPVGTVISRVVVRLTPPGDRCTGGRGDRQAAGLGHGSTGGRKWRKRPRNRSNDNSSGFTGGWRQRRPERLRDSPDTGFGGGPWPRNAVDQIAGRTRRFEKPGDGSVRVTNSTCDGDRSEQVSTFSTALCPKCRQRLDHRSRCRRDLWTMKNDRCPRPDARRAGGTRVRDHGSPYIGGVTGISRGSG